MRSATLGEQDQLGTIPEFAVGGRTKQLLQALALGER
jgi:hypothetical protein